MVPRHHKEYAFHLISSHLFFLNSCSFDGNICCEATARSCKSLEEFDFDASNQFGIVVQRPQWRGGSIYQFHSGFRIFNYSSMFSHRHVYSISTIPFCVFKVGPLDYIWYDQETLFPLGMAKVPDTMQELTVLQTEVAMPSSIRPSDHVSLLCEFAYLEDANEFASQRRGFPNSTRLM